MNHVSGRFHSTKFSYNILEEKLVSMILIRVSNIDDTKKKHRNSLFDVNQF